MKKIITLILVLTCIMSATACGGDPALESSASPSPSQSATVDPNSTQNPGTTVTPDVTTTPTPNATHGPLATPAPSFDNVKTIGEFEVSYEVYEDYSNNSFVIVNVKNTVDTPKNITLTSKFLDGSGQTVQTQTQSFEGFAANWSNYFIFKTKAKFATAEFDIETTEFTGEVLAHYIHPNEGGVKILIDKNRTDYILLKGATEKEIKKATDVRVKISAYSTFYGTPLTADTIGVLIDNNNKVFFTRTCELFNLGGIANPYLGFGPIVGDRPVISGGQDNPEPAAKVKENMHNFTNYKSFMSITHVERTVLDWDAFNEAVKENEKNNK